MRTKLHTPADFSWVRWTPQQIHRLVPAVVHEKTYRYAAIKAIPDKERTFDNTVRAVEEAHAAVSDRIHEIDFLMNVSPRRAVRNAAHAAIDELQKKLIDVEYDERLYRAVRAYASKNQRLPAEDAKLLREMLRDWRRMGLELSPAKQARLKRIAKKLARLETAFQKNINDYHDYSTLAPGETAGLSERYLRGLKKDKQGNYRVTLAYPDYFPFLQNSERADKRRELQNKYLQKGGPANTSLLNEMLALRDTAAHLLGYRNHAAFRTETTMAKNPQRILSFINRLTRRLHKGVARELATVRDLKRELTGNPAASLEYYDIASSSASYYINQLKKRALDLDEEELRAYFPLETVLKGMFAVYQKLFSVKFKKLTGYPLWHPDVSLYAIRDPKRGGVISYFLLDLYPREGKYGHAAAFEIVSGRASHENGGETYCAPVAAMVANFRKSNRREPSLVSHSEAVTLFHEFGHIMHQTLTRSRYESQAGAHVARDFVEAPSQMLENWVWDPKILSRISGHYRNPKKKLPAAAMRNLVRSNRFMVAYDAIRQLSFALFDMTIHTAKPVKPLADIYGDVVQKLLGVAMPRGHRWPAGFGHLVGYDAGYYGYMWSKVYAADMFTRFHSDGLLNPAIGSEYRRIILEKGSSEDETTLLKRFLGRKPDERAFLRELGL